MAKMIKGNRILDVDAGRVEAYLKQGYNQVDNAGKIVKRATGGRSVSLQEHNKVLAELEALKGSPSVEKELEEVKKENKTLKSEITKLKKSLDEKKSE
ncbi:hypothetical protein M3936_23405 [Sutcliffiella horikoshii]|uniref:hypothetical protein n=1 Tax=Sutcliffiella horikoshii TaxID=79883 RepID=UPI00203F087D|nr:hypothetical protein [Sutcliffiella horikoshii]MCM3620506.1 hypothetical protein [Sutcliffiella horikoshii]